MTPSIDIVFAPDLYRFHEKHQNIVLIDVLRFTSTMITALANGALSVEAYAEAEIPLKLKKEQQYVICGEYKGADIEGYDFNNSPVSMTKENVSGKKLAFCTTNGTYTRAVISDYETILAGAFLNFSALCKRLSLDNKSVTLVCSGSSRRPAVEDILFAGAVASYLSEKSGFDYIDESVFMAVSLYNLAKNDVEAFVKKNAPGKRIITETNEKYAADFDYVFQTDLYDIVPEETSAFKFEIKK